MLGNSAVLHSHRPLPNRRRDATSLQPLLTCCCCCACLALRMNVAKRAAGGVAQRWRLGVVKVLPPAGKRHGPAP